MIRQAFRRRLALAADFPRDSELTFRAAPGLLLVQFAQPVFHVAQGAQQAQPRFGQIETSVQRVLKLLSFVDARQLLSLGTQLRLSARASARAVA